MNPFEFVIAIIALSFFYKLVAVWVQQKSQRSSEHGDGAALQRRLDQVEERVRVLERIVTDDKFELKQQFRDLGG